MNRSIEEVAAIEMLLAGERTQVCPECRSRRLYWQLFRRGYIPSGRREVRWGCRLCSYMWVESLLEGAPEPRRTSALDS